MINSSLLKQLEAIGFYTGSKSETYFKTIINDFSYNFYKRNSESMCAIGEYYSDWESHLRISFNNTIYNNTSIAKIKYFQRTIHENFNDNHHY
jgi:hypothetical protein